MPIDPALLTVVTMNRFWSKTRVDSSGCLLWTGARNSAGYAVVKLDRQVYAHRVAWIHANGRDVPAGLTIDHLCMNRACVNHQHLEAVTQRVNANRSPRAPINRTHCPQGHIYAGTNLYLFPDGRRACRTCARTAQIRYRLKVATA